MFGIGWQRQSSRCLIAPLIAKSLLVLYYSAGVKRKKESRLPMTHRRPAPETATARAFEGERDALFHFRVHNFIYFNLENEGLFSKFPPRASDGKSYAIQQECANPSIPPALLHPGACKPFGNPQHADKKEEEGKKKNKKTGGRVAFPALSNIITSQHVLSVTYSHMISPPC